MPRNLSRRARTVCRRPLQAICVPKALQHIMAPKSYNTTNPRQREPQGKAYSGKQFGCGVIDLQSTVYYSLDCLQASNQEHRSSLVWLYDSPVKLVCLSSTSSKIPPRSHDLSNSARLELSWMIGSSVLWRLSRSTRSSGGGWLRCPVAVADEPSNPSITFWKFWSGGIVESSITETMHLFENPSRCPSFHRWPPRARRSLLDAPPLAVVSSAR